ncbi:cytochrome-c oxidase, cbb3-type subunit I [Calycomorphotria hydatis]|uniref:cytochrome-c oxidase n=1 Tax=Calycomorphotria hydatis TaxID=2528027 RepID=A0A517T3P7_9PLAN|nr:cytochrome-c oxidase, cbb3-type subunit I [Calycomorphotria hydatis]QDT63000.1 hypothetical protein V22_01980 [Calycomorphotria hydatis]
MSTATEATASSTSSSVKMEEFSYDDGITRLFTTATLLWGVVATLAGLFIALQLVLPWMSFGLEFLTFGRLRPLHTNAAIFAFGGNAIFAAVYYSTQRLCKCRMWSDVLSRLHFWGWQLIIVCAALTLPLGITQSKEYAELEWPIDLMVAVVWAGFFGINFFMTLLKRRERHLYVALWFYIATIVTVTILYVFNNLALPLGLFKSVSLYAGVQDAFMQWWYGHNAVAFFLTTPFLGLMYYFVPKAAERPVYSYKLSILHFWSLVFIYIWAGPHHLHYTALPEWASTLGMIFSVMLWMPSWGGMINGLLTLRGAWHKVNTEPVLKFFVVGITFYGMATFEGPLLSVKAVNALSHYTDWTIAHVHSGALGWNGMMTFGMAYWLLPRIYQTQLFSKKMAEWHFWLATAGILLYIVPIYIAGLTQGLMWRAINDSGQLAYPDFVQTVQALIPLYWVRVLGGLLYVAGAVMCVYNAFMTWKSRPATYEVVVHRAPALSKTYEEEQPPAPPEIAMLDSGKRISVWASMWWHRVWERKAMLFTWYVLIAVSVASLFEIIPTFLIRSNVPIISTVEPYTPLELAGRDIFVAEGCYNCHSQMIRPLLSETKRYGEYSKAGEFIYDRPFQWGSRRIGPDLAREGGKQSNLWHAYHFQDPQKFNPGSIMPVYGHLISDQLNFKEIQPRVITAWQLGAPYDVELELAEDLARSQASELADDIKKQILLALPEEERSKEREPTELEQLHDKKVIAVIAYLQRLGIDLFKTPAPAPPPAATASSAETGGDNG